MRLLEISSVVTLLGVSLAPEPTHSECTFYQEVIPGRKEYTNDFYYSASLTEGAPGEVVGIDLSLTVESLHGGCLECLSGGGLVAAYDPQVAELLGEPVYSDTFTELSFVRLFNKLTETEGNRGFLIAWAGNRPTILEHPEWFSGIPIHIGTVYFRIKGAVGGSCQVRIADNVLHGSTPACIQNLLNYSSSPSFEALSTRHMDGLVQIVDREPIHTELPPLPPEAKTYPDIPTPAAASVRYELTGSPATPGGITEVDFFIRSDIEFVGYAMGGKFPTEHLELERIEILTTPGAKLIDNERGEFGILSANSIRRMGAEGESFRAARLYFRVKETARDGEEIRITLEDLKRSDGLSWSYVNWIRFLREDSESTHLPAEVSPLSLTGTTLNVQAPLLVRRGDANSDQRLDISDAVGILRHLFLGGALPACPGAADFDRNERLDITDPIAILNFLFLGKPPVGELDPGEVPCA